MDNEQKLDELFVQLFSYSFPKDFKDNLFFEEPVYMKARHFAVLILEVEKAFNIRFPDELIDEMKLVTYHALLCEINRLTSLQVVS
ncbi:hypothetical protein DCC85_16075 [Paenibacillus sp. CAA11]|uniref:hypothetical protein n=1 Tax=Paenibacillus sp. CAA11 TaxID=1532905 RepID=UPI000D33CC10|nr:hypothetical protein [Paenibacillus sp. CAA11]AWB45568.1 hypothetical protein DCC85_16075 [Paenibacillus sp. CAA11]